MPDIHKKITAVRKLRDFSQSKVAELSNIPLRTYQRIESGYTSVNIDYLTRIAEAFKCSINDILHFNLEANQFPSEQSDILEENKILKAENSRLSKLVNKLLDKLPWGGAK